jgi:putative ABC transport system permease protein
MNIVKLAIKNIKHQWLDSALSILLLAFGVGAISMLILVEKQTTEQFNKNIQDIDMVLGAKGSPLQLILANVYHVDAPTGNIKVGEAKIITQNPTIETAIPLAYGDNYQQWRIVGTDQNYALHYNMKLQQGVEFQDEYEATIGAEVAQSTGLKLGDTFLSTHGLDQEQGDEEHAHNHGYKVVGVYEKSGTVIDKLILTPVETIWHAHEEEPAEEPENNTAAQDSLSTPPVQPVMKKGPMMMLRPAHAPKVGPNDNKEVTAYLLKKRTPMAQIILPGLIKDSKMQLALPAIEINRLSQNFGIGMDTIQAIAVLIMALSFISIFVSLYNSLKKRKYELALMRSMGASKWTVFSLIQLEGIITTIIGIILGGILSRFGLSVLSQQLNNSFHYQFQISDFSMGEIILVGTTIAGGVLACAIPAYQAYKLDISKTLAHE